MVFCGLVGTKGEWDNHSTPNGETVSLILDFRRFKVYIAVDPLALTARVRKWECCAKLDSLLDSLRSLDGLLYWLS
jgi:hypothetical protein